MSDIPGRLYQAARAYLDVAKERLSEIDARAQQELDKALTHADIQSGLASSDDPMARAQAKIAASRAAAGAAAPETSTAAPPSDPIHTAYKIIGVPNGSDYLDVQSAVQKLRERCSPSRFPAGSQEQVEAQQILQRVEDAFHVLQNFLDPGAGRFDKLEI